MVYDGECGSGKVCYCPFLNFCWSNFLMFDLSCSALYYFTHPNVSSLAPSPLKVFTIVLSVCLISWCKSFIKMHKQFIFKKLRKYAELSTICSSCSQQDSMHTLHNLESWIHGDPVLPLSGALNLSLNLS